MTANFIREMHCAVTGGGMIRVFLLAVAICLFGDVFPASAYKRTEWCNIVSRHVLPCSTSGKHAKADSNVPATD